jgi:hypothetical protein
MWQVKSKKAQILVKDIFSDIFSEFGNSEFSSRKSRNFLERRSKIKKRPIWLES